MAGCGARKHEGCDSFRRFVAPFLLAVRLRMAAEDMYSCVCVCVCVFVFVIACVYMCVGEKQQKATKMSDIF